MKGVRKIADPPSRGAYHHGHLRDALVEAAAELVAVHGVEGFSLREAARAVGVSPAAAYRHFEDKSALLFAVAMDGMGRLAAMMDRAISRAPGPAGTAVHAAAAFAAVGEAYVEFAVRHPSHFNVMFGSWCDTPPSGEKLEEAASMVRHPYQILVDILDDLVTAGAVTAEARQGAEVPAWSAVHGLSSLLVNQALELTRPEREAALALVTRNLLAGLGYLPPRLPPPQAIPAADPRCVEHRQRVSRKTTGS
jgi:AcrR family transcriptional regulator